MKCHQNGNLVEFLKVIEINLFQAGDLNMNISLT